MNWSSNVPPPCGTVSGPCVNALLPCRSDHESRTAFPFRCTCRQRPGREQGNRAGPVPPAASAAPVHPLSLPEPSRDMPRERMAWLVTILEHHNYLYHTLDKPIISDDQYDALFRELKALEEEHPQWRSPHSPTLRVGRTAGRAAQAAPPPAHVRSGQCFFRRGMAGNSWPECSAPCLRCRWPFGVTPSWMALPWRSSMKTASCNRR